MKIIGRGGYGVIYEMSDPNYVKKVHGIGNEVKCKSLSNEFSMQRLAYEVTINNRFYGVPKPKRWEHDGSFACSYIMERIYPPDNGKISWHVYWDHDDHNFDYVISKPDGPIRGRYLGLRTLVNMLPNLDLQNAAYNAGSLLASVQYGSLQTARDTELIIGHTYKENTLKLFLIDYDRSEYWSVSEPPYEELMETLEDESYWPFPGSIIYNSFEKGYLNKAKNYGLESIAIRVLNKRTEDFS